MRYYARVVNKQVIDTDYISKEIQYVCTLTGINVGAVDTLIRSMETHLKEERRVHLNGIGYFDMMLTCLETRDPKRHALQVYISKTSTSEPTRIEVSNWKFKSYTFVGRELLGKAEGSRNVSSTHWVSCPKRDIDSQRFAEHLRDDAYYLPAMHKPSCCRKGIKKY